MFKGQKGITLVALVITIIVLLILAGVALATLTGRDNIIDNANNAVEKYKDSTKDENATYDKIDALFKKYLGDDHIPTK